MAQKRMFSKTITNSSRFLMMPQSSQSLYFHLGMNADDDGFCEHFPLMRMTESKPDDLKILQVKGFIRIFDDKILIILDWKENNYLRADRYTPSKYLEIYKCEIKGLSSGIPTVATDKVSIGKIKDARNSTNCAIPNKKNADKEEVNGNENKSLHLKTRKNEIAREIQLFFQQKAKEYHNVDVIIDRAGYFRVLGAMNKGKMTPDQIKKLLENWLMTQGENLVTSITAALSYRNIEKYKLQNGITSK